jgi:hypothetical protein
MKLKTRLRVRRRCQIISFQMHLCIQRRQQAAHEESKQCCTNMSVTQNTATPSIFTSNIKQLLNSKSFSISFIPSSFFFFIRVLFPRPFLPSSPLNHSSYNSVDANNSTPFLPPFLRWQILGSMMQQIMRQSTGVSRVVKLCSLVQHFSETLVTVYKIAYITTHRTTVAIFIAVRTLNLKLSSNYFPWFTNRKQSYHNPPVL